MLWPNRTKERENNGTQWWEWLLYIGEGLWALFVQWVLLWMLLMNGVICKVDAGQNGHSRRVDKEFSTTFIFFACRN